MIIQFKKIQGTDLNGEFPMDEAQMSEKYIKECAASLAIKEIQMKTTLRFHLNTCQNV